MRRTPLRRVTAALLVLVAVALMVLGLVGPAGAQTTTDAPSEPTAGDATSTDGLGACPADRDGITPSDSQIRTAKVAGLLDPVVFDYLIDQLDQAEADPRVEALIIQVNSRGSVIDDADYLQLATRLRESPLQIALWVGLVGSTAEGGVAELATVADVVGVTPDSSIGRLGERRLPESWGDPFADVAGEVGRDVDVELISADESVAAGVSVGPLQNTVPIGSFATELDGYDVLRCLDEDGNLQTIPLTQLRLSGLSLTSQLFHTAASPEVAYLFFALGVSLLVFELFTAGVGIAGVIGAGFMALGSYGLAVLPTRWWAIALLLLAFVFLAVDIQTNVPRLYTVVGLVLFVLGSWFLYNGVSMSWVTLGAVWIGALLYAYTGMPSMVRTRFSTPTIGRTWMIGELGEAVTDVDPEGTVRIRNATWRAITNRATPVTSGGRVRVIGIDRLMLEIEPEEGGAKDYRERS